MSSSSSSVVGSKWRAGDRVWVKTGRTSGSSHEELGIILSSDATEGTTGGATVVVKFSTSGYVWSVTEPDRIRPMEDTSSASATMTTGKKTLRRSGRRSSSSSAMTITTHNNGTTAAATVAMAASRVTPSPADLDDGRRDSAEAGGIGIATKRKRGATCEPAVAEAEEKRRRSADRVKKKAKVESPYFAKGGGGAAATTTTTTKSDGKRTARGRKLLLASDDGEEGDNDAERDDDGGETKQPAVVPSEAKATTARGKKRSGAKKTASTTGKKNSKIDKTSAAKAETSKKTTAAARAEAAVGDKKSAAKAKSETGRKKAAATKARSETGDEKAAAKTNTKTKTKTKTKTEKNPTEKAAAKKKPPVPPVRCLPANRPDGNGNLDQQPSSGWVVEYAKSGRATCRSCDERILKGEVRAGNAPLFRGKPGYMVYRHLRCATFSSSVRSALDVTNHECLSPDDYADLVAQVEISAERLEEEQREIRPDELVQKTFEGEIRGRPEGLAATLLPFQVEGFSWMRHQETQVESIRGGILADEMGMGKTIQAIATILDNRPKLQHSIPGAKHPPTPDLPQRQAEELLWDKAKTDWSTEMDLLKVSKKLRSRDGGARAGTLVICPVIALTQWKSEIEKFTEEEGTLTVCIYHGPEREKATPREMMKKYDVVLTTYQVLEADFRKMTSPNRVECPNCGGKFKIDKLPIHLKYFCGDTAQRTEAQSRQVRNSDRGGRNGGGRRGGRPGSVGRGGGGGGGNEKKGGKKKFAKRATSTKEDNEGKKPPATKKKPPATKSKSLEGKEAKKRPAPKKKKKPAKKSSKKAPPKKRASTKGKPEEVEETAATATPRAASGRSAARRAASRISSSAAEWAPGLDDDDDSEGEDNFASDVEPSDDDDGSDDEDSDSDASSDESSSEGDFGDSSGDESALERAREKQRQALETSGKKRFVAKGKRVVASKAKAKGKQTMKKEAAKGGKGKKKKFDESSDDNYSSDYSSSEDEIDMQALLEKAMAGAKNSVLHSVCWWRIVLDEAHFIKSRSSQTANAAFSLIGIHRWCLSGTPLQNRVGEFYSLVRFLRLDPMAYYFCRCKDCDCKSLHYRIVAGICEACGHGGIQHHSHFNKYILNPIQRDGYSGDGRRAMFLLKNEVLDKALLRRTKETRAADMELPPRLVQIKPIKLHPIEEDFYSALYTQTKSSFNDYVDSGTLLNNYAHIFDLLIRMRQSVDHPYLVVHSKKNADSRTPLSLRGDALAVANGSVNCDLCQEPPTDRVVSTCCGAAYCRACVLEYMATANGMASENDSLTCPSCREAFSIDLQARADVEDDSSLNVAVGAGKRSGAGAGMPSLKELKHVATGSILRRINLAEFATSSKIEALTRELVLMRQTSPGSKAIVFSQFVNMLDLIRWRLHSDPYLEDIGLGCRALHGGMNVKARDACLKDFREDNNVRVLLMSLKAGGVALNLTCANYIYLMDPWWNPAAEMQAIDRTHRLGQYRPIRAVRFIAEDTVEERILQLQEKKRLVFDGTVGRDAGSLKMLTVDDMKSLFA